MAIRELAWLDPELIKILVRQLPKPPWPPSREVAFKTTHGDTQSLILRSQFGVNGFDQLDFESPCKDTETRAMLPGVESILDLVKLCKLGTTIHKIVIASLKPGGIIGFHTDNGAYFEDKSRVHVPLVTNKDVAFYSEDKEYYMEVGGVYDLDNKLGHAVANRSSDWRIHLIMDIN